MASKATGATSPVVATLVRKHQRIVRVDFK